MRKDREVRAPIDEYEYQRLLALYRQRTDPHRRAPERVERPINIMPSVHGGKIVNWTEYMDLVSQGKANYPPARDGRQ